jgi:thiol:disulfide interchange protein DsbA
MNCEAIDSVLDEHRTALLSPAERQETAQHVGGCARCTDVWLVDDALRAEAIGDPPPELFAALLQRVAAAPAPPRGASRSRSIALAGAAAIALGAIVAGLGVLPEGVIFSEGGVITKGPVSTWLWSTLRNSVNAPSQAAARLVAGRDYDVLAAGLPSTADPERVTVVEFFGFWCFPCYAFEPELARWSAEAPAHVAFTRVPVIFGAYAEAALHARAFYAAEALGKLDTMHAAFYDEIHVRGNRLASREALAEFFARFGVDGATFDATFDSSEVDERLQRAVALSREYGIDAVPALVVAGRYVTSSSMVGPDVLAVVDELVTESRARQTEEP